MKKIKLLVLFFFFFINIENVFASEDIYLEANSNKLEIEIDDTNVFNDTPNRTLEYTYHDNKDNTGAWYSNNKDKEKNYVNIKDYSNNKLVGDFLINNTLFKDVTVSMNNNKGKLNITNNNKYINGRISFKPSKYLSIIIKSNSKVYGLVGEFVNNKSLKLIDCLSNDFEITSQNNRILFESIKGIDKGALGICKFEKTNENIGYLYLNNITISNKEKEINHDNLNIKITSPKINDIVYSKINNYINNSNTKSNQNWPIIIAIIILTVLLLILLLFILKKNNKKRLKIIILIISLIPLNAFALNNNIINNSDINKIRRNILNNNYLNYNEKNKLDIDKDNKITINDLILAKIKYNTPTINIKDGTIEKKQHYEYYSNVNKIVEITSISNLTSIKYCLTEDNYCEPDKNYEFLNNNVSMNIKFENNKNPQKLCIKASNNYNLENTECEDKTYLVDNNKPELKLKSSKIYIGENDTYDINSNIEARYGISGGNFTCVGKIDYGSNTITCKAIGNNGLSNEIKYEIIKSITYNKSAIFFGDSITYGYANNGYGWGDYIKEHYDLSSVVNAGKSGWFISNNLNRDWIVDIVKTQKNNNYDYIILHGGCNDINKNVPLGTFNDDDFSGNYDTNTFLGGLEYYLYNATTTWKHSRIGYIVNYKTPNNQGRSNTKSAPYYTEMKKVLEKWNISYLDLFDGTSNDGKSYSDILKVNTNEYLPDTLHLNSSGYTIISPYIYNWMKELTPYS